MAKKNTRARRAYRPNDRKLEATIAFCELAAAVIRPGAKRACGWQEPPLLYQSLVRTRKMEVKHGKEIESLSLENIAHFKKDVHVTKEDWPECWLLDRLRHVNQEKGRVTREDLGDVSQFNVSEKIVTYWIKFFRCLNKEAEKVRNND